LDIKVELVWGARAFFILTGSQKGGGPMNISRLSISQITTNNWGFEEAVRNYAARGISNMGVWVDKIAHLKNSEVRRILNDRGMTAFNLCFAGLFTGDTQEKRDTAIDTTKKTLEVAKEIGAGFLLIVAGPTLPRHLEESRDHVQRALEALVPFAENIGAKMALEAIHPIDISRWCVIVTMAQALSTVRAFSSPSLGVLLDLYNTWWEPGIEELIGDMRKDLLGVHVADWNPETLKVDSRLLPGQGVIPLERLIKKVEMAGYQGCYDIEIFNEKIWSDNYDRVLADIVKWFKGLEMNS
jgi:sugar phosphate isomerase/epimerase